MTPVFGVEWRAGLAVMIRCSAEAGRALRCLALLIPLVPWMVLRAASALWLGAFPTPPRDRLGALWEIVGGGEATSFPFSSAVLPRVMAWCDPLLELVVGVLGVAVACALLPDVFRGGKIEAGRAWRRGASRLGPAWVAAAPGILGAGALTTASDLLGTLPTVGPYARGLSLVLAILCRAFFVYAIAAVVIGGVSPVKAWRRSATLAGRFLGPTCGLVAFSYVAAWPWKAAPHLFAAQFDRFAPDWITPWVALGAAPVVVITLFVTAATARLYLHGYGAREAR